MTSAVRLRAIGSDDVEFLAAVYASTREEELAAVEWPAERKQEFLRSQFEAQHRYYQHNYAGASFDLVLLEDLPVGRLYVARWPEELRVVDIALLPEFRRRGIGSFLMEGLIREAAERGVPVRIHVERFNPALDLYGRLGFRLLEDRGVYLFLERPCAARTEAGGAAAAGDDDDAGAPQDVR